MEMKMTFNRVFITSLFCSALLASTAHAQLETVQDKSFDCTYEKAIGDTAGDFIRKNLKVDDLIGEVTNKRRKKYSLRAANQAIEAGYNYAYMRPLKIIDRRYRQRNVNIFGGEALSSVHGSKWKNLKCTAFDDIAAYNYIIGENVSNIGAEGGAIVDLRKLIATVDEGNSSFRPRKPQIAAEHLEGIGTRERVAKQYPIMMEALACSHKLNPTSSKNFVATITSDQQAQENQCLSSLRSRAQSVGLDFTKSVREDTASLGYHINRPVQTPQPATPSPATAPRPMADASLWGDNWFDINPEFGGIDGVVLHKADANFIVVASNNLADNQLLDYAVFISAKEALFKTQNIAILGDRTAKYREFFNGAKERLAKQEIENATDQAQDFDRTVTDRDIARLEDKIRRNEEEIIQLQQPVVENPDDFAELEETMKQIPNGMANFEDMKNSIREAQAVGRATKITHLRQSITDERANLNTMKTTYASESSQIQQMENAIPSSSTIVATLRPSDKARSTDSKKAIFRAFENYQNVLVLTNYAASNCREEYLVCADKLQAYNTLGARLNVVDFTPFSTPVGYKPYLPK